MQGVSKLPTEQRRLFAGMSDNALWTRFPKATRQECEQHLARLFKTVVRSERDGQSEAEQDEDERKEIA